MLRLLSSLRVLRKVGVKELKSVVLSLLLNVRQNAKLKVLRLKTSVRKLQLS